MVTYDTNNTILKNIARIIDERLPEERKNITIKLDKEMDKFSGKIDGDVILGGSYPQILEAAGRIIRHPEIKSGTFKSKKELCGIYFATHFKNYLNAAPLEEIYHYIDDLSLWGLNTIKFWFDLHHFKNMDEGREDAERFKSLMSYAKSIGLQTIMTVISNEAFNDSPLHLRADWTSGHDGYIHDLNDHYHLEICPSKEGGMEQIIEYRRQMLNFFKDVNPDYISCGAYDEGGCTCPDCAPWGANGYIKTLEALIPVFKEYFPNIKIIASFWQFGTFTGNDVEFEGFYDVLREGRLKEVEYIVAEPQYVRYPFEHDKLRPLINFPEISMWNAYPWGGYGANPMPKMLGMLWERDGDKLEGGYAYSEGIYEDINKAIVLRLYRDGQKPQETVREYLAYEFGLKGELLEKMTQAVFDMENTYKRECDRENHRYIIENTEEIDSIYETVEEVNSSLSEKIRKSIKWQMFYLRAKIDKELVKSDFYRSDKVMEYFKEIVRIAHLENSGPYTKPDVEE